MLHTHVYVYLPGLHIGFFSEGGGGGGGGRGDLPDDLHNYVYAPLPCVYTSK